MKKSFGGPTVFLDRSDINTDEIIPAKYLTYVDKMPLKPHLLEDIILDNFDLTKSSLVHQLARHYQNHGQ